MRVAGAVDVGGTGTKIGIVGEDGSILTRTTIPTSARGEPEPLVKAIVATLAPMLAGKQGSVGVGVSVAGFLDREHETMFGNANLPALCGFRLHRALEDALALDCRLEVDSNAAVVAEYRHGAGRGARRLLGVTVGTGLGGGVIVDGRLLRYTGECAGDLGHIILDPNGRRCTCGARGCLEAMVGSAARAEQTLAETGRWLGLGLASLAQVFAPDRIVVGGGAAAAGDRLLDPVRESYRAHASPEFGEKVHVVISSFDGWEGMIGAASLFLDPIV
jgi:glucokinase